MEGLVGTLSIRLVFRAVLFAVGESYGGTRAALMLDRLFNYQLLATTGAA
jgi:hypothetical protein